MVKLTEEMRQALKVPGKGGSLVYLATSSLSGKPNIAAMRYVDTWGDDKILISDMFLLKTKMNLKENSNAIIAICHPLEAGAGRWWAFKGKAIDIEYGFSPNFDWFGLMAKEVLDGWGDWHTKEPPEEVPPDIVYPVAAQRGVVVLHIEEIYSLKAGQTGNRMM